MSRHSRHIIPWLFFAGAMAFCLYTPFSYWAINAKLFGKQDMGFALFFSFSFPVAIYAACAISFISLLLAPFYRKPDRPGSNILLLSALVGALPFMFLLALDLT
jgi:hypothetical protein